MRSTGATKAVRKRGFDALDPISWGLGANFVFGLKNTVLYSLFPDRADGRDWMSASVLQAPPDSPDHEAPVEAGDYWFDFVADTGDSGSATYSVAHLLHGTLFVSDAAGVVGRDDPAAARGFDVVTRADAAAGYSCLPRGAFLLAGNDTAYSVADERTIRERFVAPFDCAYAERFSGSTPPGDRLLLGIPGNHDWYDALDGFNRLFRRPPGGLAPAIPVRGFRAAQEASYFALQLPDGLQIWGIDGQSRSHIDTRQREFFRNQKPERGVVLVTPAPAVANGQRSGFVEDLLAELKIERKQVRLWISGNDHHYARYAGLDQGDASPPCIVCGLGGASLQVPTLGRTPADVLHPDPAPARAQVWRRLASPAFMLRRTYLWIAGAVLGFMLGAALASRDSEAASLARALGVAMVHASQAFRPWALLTALAWAAASALMVFAVVHVLARDEREARRRPSGMRAGLGAAPVFAVPLAGIGVPLVIPDRTFGSTLLDLGFYLVLGLTVLGVPIAMLRGLPGPRPPVRGAALCLVGLAAGAAILAAGTAAACASIAMLPATSPYTLVAVGGLAAALAEAALLPWVVGLAFAVALRLGAHVGYASSLAMIDDYQAFIRFRLRTHNGKSSLTGFVVSVTRGVTAAALRAGRSDADLAPRAKLIDVFTVSLD